MSRSEGLAVYHVGTNTNYSTYGQLQSRKSGKATTPASVKGILQTVEWKVGCGLFISTSKAGWTHTVSACLAVPAGRPSVFLVASRLENTDNNWW